MKVAVWNLGEPVGIIEGSDIGYSYFDPEMKPMDNTKKQEVSTLLTNVGTYYHQTKEAKTPQDVLSLLVERGCGYWEFQEIELDKQK